MKWFNDVKISIKLIICFVIVSLFVGAVGYIGINNMGEISNNSSALYNDDLKTLVDIQGFNSNTLNIRLQVINLVEGEDGNKAEETKNTIQNFRNENNKLLADYEKSN